MKEIELIGLRGKREKHFLQEDGIIVAKMYDDNIHYKKNGVFEDINNTLVKEKNYYTNISNDYKVFFNTDYNDKLIRMENDLGFIEFDLVQKKDISIKRVECVNKLKDTIKYENILSNIDLEYNVLPTKVKENIILKNKESINSKLIFCINSNLELYDKESRIIATDGKEEVFIFENPYMIDSNGKINSKVFYELYENNGLYFLKINLDEKWLENAAYPVIIDPTINNRTDGNSVIDTYIYPGDTNIDRGSEDILKAGVERINGQDRINRSLIKFNLPTIGTGSQIVKAMLDLVGYVYMPHSYESDMINVHRITQNWAESGANWITMNDKFDSRIECSFESRRSYLDGTNLMAVHNGGDITSLVKKWYSGLENNGIMLKETREVYRSDVIPAYYSKNNSIIGDSPKPILQISYRNQNGLENYMDYEKQIFSYGNAYINTYNGNLITEFNVGETIGGKFPTTLSLIYNTNDVVLNNNIGLGIGYKFNLYQTIKSVVIDNVTYLEYLDDDGTLHYFLESNTSNEYKDEDGLNLKITVSNNKYILTKPNGSKLEFTITNNVGYLTKILDNKSNENQIIYTNNLITKIKDGNNIEINITYDSNTITIISPSKTIYLNINNGKIISIEKSSKYIQFTYDSHNIISSITDIDGKKICYEYYDTIPYRVKKVSEYGINNTIGKNYQLQYNFNSTTITNGQNHIFTKTFNNYGNLVSSMRLQSENNIENAYGKGSEYGVEIQSPSGMNTKYKNKLLGSDILNKYVKNYLTDSSFENSTIDFLYSNNVTATVSQEEAKFGIRSLKLVSSSANGEVYKNINISKDNYYTFSAYIKNTNNLKLSLSYVNSENQLDEVESEIINSSNVFSRYDVTIFYPSTALSDLTIKFKLDTVGTAYVDAIQLENGEVSNYYNLLDNSDFSLGLSDWTMTSNDIYTFDPIPTSNVFSIVDINNDGKKTLKISMDPLISSSIRKRIYINGTGGDKLNLSFWYKNEGFPTMDSDILLVTNNVLIRFNYLDQSSGHGIPAISFNPNENQWQYFSFNFTAERDYDYVELIFLQSRNANNCYITNLYLCRDLRSTSYNYDDNGNIIQKHGIDNQTNNYTYDSNNNLISFLNPKSKRISFEYDKNIDKFINAISDFGLADQVKYDNNDNISAVIIRKNGVANIKNGLYKIRLKGTNKFLRNINNNIEMNEDNCNHDLWDIEKVGDYYKICHSIINNKFFNNINSHLVLSEFNGDNSLFSLIKRDDNCYLIKTKNNDLYLKQSGNNLIFESLVEDDNNFEFFFEIKDGDLFIETDAKYTNDGRFFESITDSLFNKTMYVFDNDSGLLIKQTNPKKQITNYNYDNDGNLISISKGEKQVVYTYNNNNLLSNIQLNSKNYNFVYDDFLNVKQVKIGNNITLVTNNYYNNNGKLLSTNYGNNQSISYEYDEFDRIKKINKMNDIYNYKYGNNGDLRKIISNNDIIKYTYDLSKRLCEYSLNDNYKVNYEYDINNNIVRKKNTLDSITNEIETIYDNNDSVIRIEFDNNEINQEYDNLGRIINKNINNEFNIQYSYVTNGKRTSFLIKRIQNGDDIYSYDYDKLNNIIRIYHNDILEISYDYDEYNQLISEINYKLGRKINYTYDIYGNIKSQKTSDLFNKSIINCDYYQYGNDNWIDQLTMFNGDTIIYDNMGNPLTIGNDIELYWENGRQLSQYIDLNNVINYEYNVDGIRTKKTIDNIETKYYLDGNKIIFEITGNNMIYYIRNSLGELIGFKYNSDVYYYIKNNQQDIVGLLDSNYSIIAKYTYDSWGNILSITDGLGNDVSNNSTHIANINPYRYKEYYYDKETKLYYLNSRYYNPMWRRFLNCDKILANNSDNLAYNPYIYASNNPVSYVDSDGNKSILSMFTSGLKSIAKGAKEVFKFGSRVAIGTVSELASVFGLENASWLLINSLQDNPPAVLYNDNSDLAGKIKKNSEFQAEMASLTKYPNVCIDRYGSVNLGFESRDLGLAIHNADYRVTGYFVDGKGKLSVTLTDTYDFKHQKYGGYNPYDYFVTFINNTANVFEGMGVINNYDIVVCLNYEVNN